MRIPLPRLIALGMALFICAGVSMVVINNAGAAGPCPAPAQKMRFDEQTYIDMTRAGGEPTVETHPDGTLLYGSHAGTTHFYSPSAGDPTTAAFVENYNGQTYYYYSEDNGKTWVYVDRTLPPNNSPMQGFSDPEFGIDKAGQVYISEINLLNVAVSKSTDKGRSYTLQNFFGQTVSDRQWKEGDEKDVVYLVGNELGGGTFPSDPAGNVGHYIHKSKDGGATFSPGISDPDGLGDIQVDKRNGTLYTTHLNGGTLSMAAFRKARSDDFTPDVHKIADGVNMQTSWPNFDIDQHANVYVTWDEMGGSRPAGIYYAYSKDQGKTFSPPIRVDTDKKTDIWPWITVGDDGKVAIAWFQATVPLPGNDAETVGDHGWHVMIAQTLNGLGCSNSKTPGFNVVNATPDAIHTGTICQGGTACQAQAIDRRLGDYFTIELTKEGFVYAGYSDTREGGATALPGFVRQIGGPKFISGGGSGPVAKLLRPKVLIRFSDRTPRRGQQIRVPLYLAACRDNDAAKRALAGTKVTLARVDGERRNFGTQKVNSECRTTFRVTANWDSATIKGFWPRQVNSYRKGRSTRHEIETH